MATGTKSVCPSETESKKPFYTTLANFMHAIKVIIFTRSGLELESQLYLYDYMKVFRDGTDSTNQRAVSSSKT